MHGQQNLKKRWRMYLWCKVSGISIYLISVLCWMLIHLQNKDYT